MTHPLRTLLTALGLLCIAPSTAQQLSSAYHLSGYAFGHEMNPARDYDRAGYFSTPLLGQVNIGTRGNFALSDVLYPHPNGKGLVTYLHPSVDERALAGFHTHNKWTSSARYNLFSVGFHHRHTYHTLSLSMRAQAGINVPYAFFNLTKHLSNRDYRLSGLTASASTWGEVAWGFSRQVSRPLRMGGKVKFLLGGGYARVNFEHLDLNLSHPHLWTARALATAEVGIKGFSWGETVPHTYSAAYQREHPGQTTYQQIDLDNMSLQRTGLNGAGLAFDMGAEYDFEAAGRVRGLKAGIALLDVGFIRWNRVAIARNRGEEYTFHGFQNIKIGKQDTPGTPIETQKDLLLDDLSNLYSLQDQGVQHRTRALAATLNLDVHYTLPNFRELSFGLLSTTHLQRHLTWNEQRLTANLHPVKWLEGSLSLAYSTLGAGIGWVVNFHPRGCSLFIGGDNLLGKVTPQGIPLRSNTNLSLGITFPLGKSRDPRF